MHTAIQAIDNQLLRDLPTNSEDLKSQQTLKITGVHSIQKITKYLECVHCSKGIIQGTCTDIIICEHCGYMMKTDSCLRKVVAKIVIKMDDQEFQEVKNCKHIDNVMQNVVDIHHAMYFHGKGILQQQLGMTLKTSLKKLSLDAQNANLVILSMAASLFFRRFEKRFNHDVRRSQKDTRTSTGL
ncbi:hypothetical protein pdam_00023642 [Pocillopora damicornis]|uniref:Uncharacterized protein n=1 Tax=Pocillopora damicornis TaxID=46731 RepID=A0A3M6TUY6_POCDA|nr:hypothetical protein pdam_00023642 [Pocillopora damicornis]